MLYNLVLIDTPLPVSVTETGFVTRSDGQTSIRTEICESLFKKTEMPPGDGNKLGDLELTFPRPLARGTAIHVTFELNKEGRLLVKACEPQTNSQISTEIDTAARLSDAALQLIRNKDAGKKVS